MVEIDNEKDETKQHEDGELIERFTRNYRSSKQHQRGWAKEAREMYDIIAGWQLTPEERQDYEEQLKPYVQFNRVDPVVSAVVGHQINNRQEIKYIPRNKGDAQPNEILSGAAKYVDDESDALDEVTDAFWDMAVCGMGWTETHVEYDEDPEGKIYGADRVPPLQMGWDPTAKKRNVADARYVFRDKWFPREEAESRWPALKGASLEGMSGGAWFGEYEDEDDSIFDDQAGDYGDESEFGEYYKEHANEVLITQYQYYELEPVYVVGDPMTGRKLELDESIYKKLKSRIEKMGAKAVRQMRRKYYQCWFAGPNLLEKVDSPAGNSFSLLCVTGKRDERRNTWYGLVRAMRDPQKWSNKVFTDITSILYKNRTGGAFVEEDALVNPRKAEEEWAEESPLIIVANGAIQSGRIKERNPINYPSGLDRLMEFAVQSIPQVTGISMELMGLTDRQQAGVLEMQRKKAGMTILAMMFDSLRRHAKARARVLKHYITEYISDGRLIRIVGGDGLERFVPLLKEQEVMKYDIVVSEAPTSPNQKDETFLVLRELVPQMAKMGVTPPADMIDYLPLPSQMIEKWKQQIEAAKKDPMIKKRQEIELAEREAAIQRDKSAAKKDDSVAMLNQVKAMVENMEARLNERLKPVEQLSKMLERAKPKA